MKTLHINDYRSAGGCEVVAELTVSLLRSRGIEAQVFTIDDVDEYRRTPLSYIESTICKKALARRLAEYRPDVVHLHNFYHVLSPGILAVLETYGRQHSLTTVMTAHDYHLVCPNAGLLYCRRGRLQPADASRLASLTYLLTRRWDNRTAAHSLLKIAQHVWNYRLHRRREVIDRVLCPSRFIQGVLERCGLPCMYLAHPAPQVRSTRSKPSEPLRLVFSGRVEPEKGLDEFLERLPVDFPGRVTVVGDGSRLERCREICQRRRLERMVRFTGRLGRDEAMAIVAQSHVLVLPSLWVENSPLSLLEALAVGTSILVSDFGGMKEIVECAGVGFMFTPGNPQSLAEALDRVVACFGHGTLNEFDVSRYLSEHNEQAYLDRLIRAYRRQWSASDDPREGVGVTAI